MATMTLTKYRSVIRSLLNESSTTSLSDTELNTIINDGYKDVCAKALCYESRLTKENVSAAEKLISLVGLNVIKVNYVEYYTSNLGMMEVLPTTVGHVPINGYSPQYWFQWGDYIYIEPAPDVATYDLYLYASLYPAAVLSSDSDTPSSVPEEFHEEILNFATAYSCLKLKRWGDAAFFYNKYIANIQKKKMDYMKRFVEPRTIKELPDSVTVTNG